MKTYEKIISTKSEPSTSSLWFDPSDKTLKIFSNGKWEPLGNEGGSAGGGMMEVTTQELRDLRDNSQLIPGTYYRITDYSCIANGGTLLDGWASTDYQFDIIVLALDVNHISTTAYATHHDGDTHFQNSDLSKWKLEYTLDGEKLGPEYTSLIPRTPYLRARVDVTFPDTNISMPENLVVIPTSEYDEGEYHYWQFNIFVGSLRIHDSQNLATLETNYFTGDWEPITAEEVGQVFKRFMGLPEEAGFDLTVNTQCAFVTRMVDEFGNDFPYDFKNLQPMMGQFIFNYCVAEDIFEGVEDYSLTGNVTNVICKSLNKNIFPVCSFTRDAKLSNIKIDENASIGVEGYGETVIFEPLLIKNLHLKPASMYTIDTSNNPGDTVLIANVTISENSILQTRGNISNVFIEKNANAALDGVDNIQVSQGSEVTVIQSHDITFLGPCAIEISDEENKIFANTDITIL